MSGPIQDRSPQNPGFLFCSVFEILPLSFHRNSAWVFVTRTDSFNETYIKITLSCSCPSPDVLFSWTKFTGGAQFHVRVSSYVILVFHVFESLG